MTACKRFQINAIGASSVTLDPVPASKNPEDAGKAGQPNLFGTGTIVITQGATPDATFWKVARRYKVTVEVVDG
jgi:hypothetical protein